MSSEAVEFDGQPALDLLRATTRVLHFVVPRFGKVDKLDELFTESFRCAMTALADSLSDRLMLCACLGALSVGGRIYPCEVENKVCSMILKMVRLKGLHEAIFITLDEVMKVLWSVMVPLSPAHAQLGTSIQDRRVHCHCAVIRPV